MPPRRKLIEVTLPLEAINEASQHEKSVPRKGHPATMHLWWARRPLAACRAVLFSSLVDDPSEYMPDEDSANTERERLFTLIGKLAKWENANNEEVLDQAKLEIARSVARDLCVDVPVGKQAIREFLITQAPPVLDPFAGGGSIPLEAQRLGLRTYASDLNPVAVLINKTLIEIPPKFEGLPPIHPIDKGETSAAESKLKRKTALVDASPQLWAREWKGAEGLAEDVRYYGQWMRKEAQKRMGHLYPPVKITAELLAHRSDLKDQGIKPGDELTPIAWLWARTVTCPNPVCGAQMPLIRSFLLSSKKGRESWIEPLISANQVKFTVKRGAGRPPDSTVNRNGAHCIVCNTPVPFDYIREEAKSGKMHSQLMCIVAEGGRGRLYLPPDSQQESIALQVKPNWVPETNLPERALGFRVQLYGMTKHADLFTSRQLVALTTFIDLANDVRNSQTGSRNDRDMHSYSDAILTYLSFAVDKLADWSSTICSWIHPIEGVRNTFARQAIPMVWDYVEINPLSNSVGNFSNHVEWVSEGIRGLPSYGVGTAIQSDAREINKHVNNFLVSTDPPYYDNIGYADLSDYFYIWQRKSLQFIYPELFGTMLVPKAQELIASPFRFDGNRAQANNFFEDGLRQVFNNFSTSANVNYPITVYYAFKQSESTDDDLVEKESISRSSTGWETMLEGLVKSQLQITGTWPVRTERESRSVSLGTNALASSIVLVCRPRPENAPLIIRRDFLAVLKRELPPGLHQLQQGNIAPVDFAQAAIGPGMAVFSRYKQVLEADGSPMRVRTALRLINQSLDEFLAEQEGEYDSDTRWALAWYEQYGHERGAYGVAETLSKAKNTSVEGLVEAGFLEARAGKVRLLKRDELNPEWDPQKDKRPTAWEACQHLIFDLEKGGEQSAAALLAKLGSLSETARDLAYRLYTVCERKSWAQDALGYNMLVVAWPRLKDLARAKQAASQQALF
jgi:putative DNA methylase